ncbi:endonuclease/exonuclease/phosphatase family protein [Chitinophaga sp. MM2321]|uniref:endonuclease/exonuclease/phosphatase family protein n=1 Tax=Chitinophaga sp. MM2321 TaxID=3137178 RepID=UPI0032D5AFCD
MFSVPQKIIHHLLRWSSILLVVCLLLSAYLPYLNPGKYWISGFAGIFFPVLFLVCLALIPLWFFYKKKYAFVILAIMLLCTKPALQTWGLHIFGNNDHSIQANSKQFTLMTYNVSSMGLSQYKINQPERLAVFDMVSQASPDILCMQEFYTNDNPDLSRNLDSLRLVGKYPYHYFTCDWVNWDTWYYGIVLFSRYPVVNAKTITCDENAKGSGKSFLQADLVIHGDTIRVLTGQLISYMFHSEDRHVRALASAAFLRKMKKTFSSRAAQALQLAALTAESPYPVIVCGDFNDTPASYTYNTISKGLQDAFLQTGSGWGRTLSYLSPTLRIDYLLPQSNFNIHSCKVFQPPLSEHFPVMACLSLKNQ